MKQRVTVIGAGIAGLSCAFDLAQAGLDVRVLDGRSEPGGVMGTVRLDGFQFETGPNSIPSGAESFRSLCDDAGLGDRLISSTRSAKTRFLFAGGGLQALPMGPGQLIRTPLLSWSAKLRAMTEMWRRFRPDPTDEDPNFETFLAQRFGRELTRTFGGAFVRGIYASEIGQLGTASAFPKLWKMVCEHGGVLRGMRNKRRSAPAKPQDDDRKPRVGAGSMDLLSLEGGLGSLPEALARSLGERLELGTLATSISRQGDSMRVETDGGAHIETDHVVLATPAGPTARLLGEAGMERPVLEDLGAVSHASVNVVSLGFERDFLPAGFGFLVPPDESPGKDDIEQRRAPLAIGVLFISKIFEDRSPPGHAAVNAIYKSEDVAGMGDDELVQVACRDLEIALPDQTVPQPHVRLVGRWPDAIPRYASGHRARVARVVEGVSAYAPNLHLIGSFVGGTSVDDRIRLGRECGRMLIAAIPTEASV